MFEYIATISTPMGLPLQRAGFDSHGAAQEWIDSRFDHVNHAGHWQITRNGVIVAVTSNSRNKEQEA